MGRVRVPLSPPNQVHARLSRANAPTREHVTHLSRDLLKSVPSSWGNTDDASSMSCAARDDSSSDAPDLPDGRAHEDLA